MYHIEHEFERQSILRVIYTCTNMGVRLTSSSEMPCMYVHVRRTTLYR